MSTRKPRILVVDDQPINIKLLERKLQREQMDVYTASNGRECIDQVALTHPDLILLDVMMPEMDGIETCQRLKANPDTQAIPVIFITARSSKEGKLEGLNVGAVDYITKPIDLDETVARVKTQLRIQEIYRENIELQKRLGETRRTAAVGAITQGIAHNLNNLLGVVVGYLDLLKNGYERPDLVKRSVTLMDSAIQRMVTIIRQLSTIATDERVPVYPIPLQMLLESTIERFKQDYKVSGDVVLQNNAPVGFKIASNAEVFESVIGRLLINAWESYPSGNPPPGEVQLIVDVEETPTGRQLVLQINDRGAGVSDEVADTMFEPFITTKTSVGRGLGLTMARHGIRSLGGDIALLRRPDAGTTARVTHPL